ncbi:hypothetical protein [Ornithinibacillus californiensis]|uniref:hypothetical protein n=1 Tax=Ornithinibacillus californiensis TaxID=161536 RepID=UPI0012ED782E|nr:hypothetical protein [Ornithinibacillus californiensis]
MKKLFASLALGTLLMGGFLFMQDNQSTDLAHGEAEPSILKMSSVSPVSLY